VSHDVRRSFLKISLQLICKILKSKLYKLGHGGEMKKFWSFLVYISFIALVVTISIIGCSKSSTESDLSSEESIFIIVEAASFHNIVYESNGKIWAWGKNDFGQLGREADQGSLLPVSTLRIAQIKAIECGITHNLILGIDGNLWAWGSNASCQLARSEVTVSKSADPLKISSIDGIVQIGCGSSHNIVLKNDGSVWAWGFSSEGRLGLDLQNYNINVDVPGRISDLSDIQSISVGKIGHNFAIVNDGTVWGWGMNEEGQLGIGSYEDAYLPRKIPGLNNVNDIQAGAYHTIILKNDGTVWACGDNTFGQLGNSSVINSNVPIRIESLDNVSQIICGGYYSFAIKNDSTVWAWGNNGYGQFGNGTTAGSYEPIYIENINDFEQISAGFSHNLMLKNDGSVWAWGYNADGQLGLGNKENVLSPTPIPNLKH
jgi:alpha-tubulin suppressor-like RCC1 family protein